MTSRYLSYFQGNTHRSGWRLQGIADYFVASLWAVRAWVFAALLLGFAAVSVPAFAAACTSTIVAGSNASLAGSPFSNPPCSFSGLTLVCTQDVNANSNNIVVCTTASPLNINMSGKTLNWNGNNGQLGDAANAINITNGGTINVNGNNFTSFGNWSANTFNCSTNNQTVMTGTFSPSPNACSAYIVTKLNQATLTVTAPASVTYGNTGTLTSSGGSGTGAVSYSAGASTGCAVAGTTLSITNTAGTCTVTATKAADTNYNATTSAAFTVTLNKANQALLTVTAPASVTYGSTGTLTSSGGSGTGAVSYSAGASTGCAVAGTTLSITNTAGTCTVTATKAADTDYNATTSAAFTVTLNRANQALLTVTAPASVTYGSTGALTSSGGSGTGAVSYSAGASTGCAVAGTTLSITNTAGTCTVTATKAADTNYNATMSAAFAITLNKANQAITFGAQTSPQTFSLGGSFSISPLASASSGLAVAYTSTTTGVCTVSGTLVTMVTVGTCTLAANQAGDTNYIAATQVTQNVSIVVGAPTVVTNTATALTTIGATLNGTVSSNGASTSVSFEYGLTTSYGSTVAATQSPLTAYANNSAVSAATSGLACATLYHFRVRAQNSANTPGFANGTDLSFTTTTCPTLSVGSASIAEGNSGTSNLTFTITQSAISTAATTVNYATTAGTATAGASCTAGTDYTTTSGTATIAVGATTTTFTVPICGDTTYENNETFTVTLSSPSGATIATATATGTITNDDTAPTLSIASVSANEGNSGTSTMTFTVTQSASSGLATTVNYATSAGTATSGASCTAGVDYVATSGTATIAAGATTATIPVTICGDTLYEANETFTVTLSSPGNAAIATATATGTITNDDTAPTLSIANVSMIEGNSGTSTITFTVTQSAATGLATTVSYATSAGTATAGASCTAGVDFVTASGTATIAAGATTATIPVTVCGDITYEGDESFTVTLSGPANATLATASATGTILNDDAPPLKAEYHFDDNVWNGTAGEVIDSSGNGYHATATLLTTASGAPGPAYTSGGQSTCRYGVFGTGGANSYVRLPNSFPGLSGSFSITAWLNSKNASAGAQRVFVRDDANDGWAMSLADFTNTSILRFFNRSVSFNSPSGGVVSAGGVAIDTTFQLSSNTWYFVALTVDTVGKTVVMYVYDVNGVQKSKMSASFTGTWSAGTGATSIGAETSASSETNLPFVGWMDELRVFSGALTQTLVEVLLPTVRPCVAGPDHYELSLPTSSINCLPTTVTVTACANNSSPCTSSYSAASGATATLGTSGATLGLTSVTFNASGVATTTLSYPLAADGTAVSVSLSGESMAATNARQCCANGTACSVANSCTSTFNTAGFIVASSAGGAVATVPTQTAGTTSGTFYLRAVQSSTTTAACTAALTGASSVNMAYQCNNPTTCYATNLMTINGGIATTIQGNPNAGVSGYTAVPMTFDAAGNAPFTLNYSDVGQTTLWFSKVINSATLTGSSNAFVVKPGGFVLSAIQQTASPYLANPAAANAAGAKFVKAGEPFSVTVTATTTPASGGLTTPNFGQEVAREGVKLTRTLVTGLGLTNNPALGGSFGKFSNGVASADGVSLLPDGITASTPFSWNEVGIITLTPSVADADYLGAGDATGTTSSNVGRFYAAKLDLTNGAIGNRADLGITGSMAAGSPVLTLASAAGVKVGDSVVVAGAGATGAPLSSTVSGVSGTVVTLSANAATAVTGSPVYAGAITYVGEPLRALFTLTAKAVDGTTTLQNYHYSATAANNFAKLDPLAAVVSGSGGPLALGAVNAAATRTPFLPCAASPAHPCLSPAQATAGTFAIGVANVSVPLTMYRDTTTPRGPYNLLDIAVAPQDSDGAILAAYNRDTVNVAAGANNHALVGQTKLLFGRLSMQNMYGSERLALAVPIQAQYWNGSTFVSNPDDSFTPLSVPAAVTLGTGVAPGGTANRYFYPVTAKNLLVPADATPALCTTTGSPTGACGTAGSPTTTLSAGKAKLQFPVPNNHPGWLDIVLNVPDYLRYNWGNCSGQVDSPVVVAPDPLPFNDLPCARATFGIFKSPLIYRRENY